MDHEIASALTRQARGFERVRLRARVVDRLQIEDRLRHEHARVEDIERTDDIGNAGERRSAAGAKPEGREVDLLTRLGDAAVDVRQHLAECDPPRAARAAERFFGRQNAEVVVERPQNRVDHRQMDRFGADRTGRNATQERIGAQKGIRGSGRRCRRAGRTGHRRHGRLHHRRLSRHRRRQTRRYGDEQEKPGRFHESPFPSAWRLDRKTRW